MTPDPIKAKIIELCPDVMERQECNCPKCGNSKLEILGSPITLAVVLRAIDKGQTDVRVAIENDGGFVTFTMENETIEENMGPKWNLEQDNYDQQSEECKQFIGSLLNV